MGTKVVSGASGKTGRIFIAGQELCVEDWNIQETGTEVETTSTCDAGKKTQEIGNQQLVGTISATWDISANPLATPPNMNVGVKHAATKMYLHSTAGVGLEDGPVWTLKMHILDSDTSVPVDGKVTITWNFKSHGSYTLPSTSDSSGA